MALATAMAKQSSSHELWIALNGSFLDTIAQIRQTFEHYLPSEQIFVYDVPNSVNQSDTRNDWRMHAAERVREYAIAHLKPDVVHVSSLFEGFGDDAIASIGIVDPTLPTAVTLYDLIPLMRSETYLGNDPIRTWYYRRVETLKKASLLLAISENSRREALLALELPEDRIVTVSTAVDSHFQPLSLSEGRVRTLRERYGLDRPFVMYTGGIDSRKNIEGLIEAYAKLPKELRGRYQLAVVCSVQPHERTRLMTIARRYQLTAREFVLTGFVPEADLVALYNLCSLFVFPSLHEGFGLPVLEAMSCGAVVVGSNTSSIPEVIGRNDALFDPTYTESITQSIYKGLTSENFRSSFREFIPHQVAKFSWQSSAKKTLEAFEQLYAKKQSSTQPTITALPSKPKLAFISPLPPEESGIATYSAELLPALSKYYSITLIVAQPKVDHVQVGEDLEIQSSEWFALHAEEFERRLYHFGNSAFHQHMFELLEEFPGTIVLHDFFLSGVLRWMDVMVGPPGLFAHSLYESHGYPALLTLSQEGTEAAVSKFPCNKTVFNYATGVIVHSQHSKKLADKWYGRALSDSWRLIPLIHASSQEITREEARESLQLKESDFLVCSFGIVAPTKLSQRLFDAWLDSKLSVHDHCYLVFVGKNDADDYGQQFLAAIKRSGMQARVTVTGYVSTEKYHQYLAAADMAVQLRTLSRGETSAATLEAMIYKLPLIVNAHGSMADYPDDIAISLPDEFSDQQLVQSLETLYANAASRHRLGLAGHSYITKHHSPAEVGLRYYQAIESFTFNSSYARYQQLLTALGTIESLTVPQEGDLATAAEAIARNSEPIGQHKLLVDVSSLVQKSLGIKSRKAMSNTVLNLLKQPPVGYRAEPIYSDGKVYRYARRFALKLLGLNLGGGLRDEPVDISRKDLFLGLDTTSTLTPESYQCLMSWHQRGVKVCLVISDDGFNTLHNQLEQRPNAKSQNWPRIVLDISNHIFCASSQTASSIKQQLIDEASTGSKLPDIDCFAFPQESQSCIDLSSLIDRLKESS